MIKSKIVLNAQKKQADELTKAQEAIKLGERTKLLWELLMETVGTSYESTFQQTAIRMREVQEAYNKGIEFIDTIIKNTPKS